MTRWFSTAAVSIVLSTAVPAAEPDGAGRAAQPEPYSRVLARVIQAWPSDLTVSVTVSDGGLPPQVTQWTAGATGRGTLLQTGPTPSKGSPASRTISLDVGDLRALLNALCEVDFEHVTSPVPDSPVQMIAITSGGRTAYVNAYALLPPVTSEAVQRRVFTALQKLSDQASRSGASSRGL